MPASADPLDGDFRIPPHAEWVKCPFADKMWTSFNGFTRIIENRDAIGKQEREIFPGLIP